MCSNIKNMVIFQDDGSEKKKAKGTKKIVIKRRLSSKITKIACLMTVILR